MTAWAQAVEAGEVVAGPYVRAAADRHLRDLVEGPKRGLKWDLAAAQRAIRFFPQVLRLNGGQFEGRPFELHPSQAFRIGSLFGWQKYSAQHGAWLRRFTRFYDEEGKGRISLKNSRLIAGPSADSIPARDGRIGDDGTATGGAASAVLRVLA